MSGLEYYYAKLIKRLRGRAIRGSTIHPTSKVEAGSEVVDSSFDRHSYCGYHCEIAHTDVGAYCSIANSCSIGLQDHPVAWVGTSPAFYEGWDSIKLKLSEHRRPPPKRVSIGNDVWIGAKTLVRGGVTIGTGAVIGMGSIVTRDVAPYAIVAGNPARTLKMRFDDQLIARLLRSEWWRLDEAVLRGAGRHAEHPDEFLKALEL